MVQLTELNNEGDGEPPLPAPLSHALPFPIGCSSFEKLGKHSWKAVGFPCFSLNSASVVVQLTELNDEGDGEPPLLPPFS